MTDEESVYRTDPPELRTWLRRYSKWTPEEIRDMISVVECDRCGKPWPKGFSGMVIMGDKKYHYPNCPDER